jgi:hypothetical protein
MFRAAFLALAGIVCAGDVARAESCFIVLFSYQHTGPLNRPWLTHTFATAVTLTDDGSLGEMHTISWLSAPGENPGLFRWSRPGANYELHETLRKGVDQQLRLSAWGPFRIDRELFDLIGAQKTRLEAGDIWYRAMDRTTRFPSAPNRRSGFSSSVRCSHAVSDSAGFLATRTARGDEATYLVARHFERFFVATPETEGWTTHPVYPAVAEKLRLDRYPIHWQQLTKPTVR